MSYVPCETQNSTLAEAAFGCLNFIWLAVRKGLAMSANFIFEASLGGSIASLLALGSAEKGAVEAAKAAAAEKAAAAARATEEARTAAAEKAAEKAEAAARAAEAKVLEAEEDDGAVEAISELSAEEGTGYGTEAETDV